MSVPGKPKPTLFELKTPKTDRMVVSEYNVWRPERTPDHVANVTMTSMERSTGLGKTLHLGTTGPGPERLSAYAHWRVQGDIYSESPSARPPPDRRHAVGRWERPLLRFFALASATWVLALALGCPCRRALRRPICAGDRSKASFGTAVVRWARLGCLP